MNRTWFFMPVTITLLSPGERRRTPVGPVRAAVAPCRRQAANVPLGAVVVRRHRRVVQEGEQLVTVLVQPLPDPHAVGMPRSGLEHQFVEAQKVFGLQGFTASKPGLWNRL